MIWLIHDDECVLEVFASMLEHCGHDFVAMQNIPHAQSALPDSIFIGAHMLHNLPERFLEISHVTALNTVPDAKDSIPVPTFDLPGTLADVETLLQTVAKPAPPVAA